MSKMIVKLSRRFYNFSDLGRLVGTEKISISKSVRQHYAHDESSHTIDRYFDPYGVFLAVDSSGSFRRAFFDSSI